MMSPTTRLALINVGGILAILVLFFLVIQPLSNSADVLNAEVIKKKSQLTLLEKQILEFKSAQADLSRATFMDQIVNSIVDREKLDTAIKKIEAAAVETNTSSSLKINEVTDLTNVKRENVIKNIQNIEEVPYFLTLKSGFNDVIDFMKYLEHLQNFTEVTSINISAINSDFNVSQTVTHTGSVNTVLDGVFFVKKKAK